MLELEVNFDQEVWDAAEVEDGTVERLGGLLRPRGIIFTVALDEMGPFIQP